VLNYGLEIDPALQLFLNLILDRLVCNFFRKMRDKMRAGQEKMEVAVKCLPVCPEPS
jgi:hypothetical protein